MIVSREIGNGEIGQVLTSDGVSAVWSSPLGTGQSLQNVPDAFVINTNVSNIIITASDPTPYSSGTIYLPQVGGIEFIYNIFSDVDVTSIDIQPGIGSTSTFNVGTVIPTSLIQGGHYSFYYSPDTDTWFAM